MIVCITTGGCGLATDFACCYLAVNRNDIGKAIIDLVADYII
jgi:hypothetical protein